MGVLVSMLLIAALLYLIGTYLWRDTPLRHVHVRGDETRLDADDGAARRAVEVLTSSRFSSGNEIDVLENGEQLFPRLLDDLRKAERLITWQVFWFKPGEIADEIGKVLCERARAGVEVRVLFDYFGAKGLSNAYIRDLRASGVQTQLYRPLRWKTLYRVPHRSHVRSVVMDGRVGYTGGFGIDDRWRGDGREAGCWRDTHVRVEGPAVDQLQAPFVANWAECTGELLLGQGVLSAQEGVADGKAAAVMYCSPSLGSTVAERFLALTITSACESLYITAAYFVPSRGFRHMLLEAVSRGVDVRVLTPGGRTDEPLAWYAGRAHYEELLQGGVRLFEYSPTMVHAKTVVADGIWVSVGSVNFDNRSLKLNDEVALVAQNRTVGRGMLHTFLRDIRHAREVELDEFRGRSRASRLKERAALLAAPLL